MRLKSKLDTGVDVTVDLLTSIGNCNLAELAELDVAELAQNTGVVNGN